MAIPVITAITTTIITITTAADKAAESRSPETLRFGALLYSL